MKKHFAYSLIFLFVISFQLSRTESKSEIDEFRSITIENFKGDSFKISDILPSSHSAIVLYSNYNCFECFSKLKQELEKIKEKDSAFKYIVVVQCSDGIIERKMKILKLSPVFKDSIIYFDIDISSSSDQEKKDNSFFSRYDVKYTPALIELNKNEVIFLDFLKLFPKEDKDYNR